MIDNDINAALTTQIGDVLLLRSVTFGLVELLPLGDGGSRQEFHDTAKEFRSGFGWKPNQINRSTLRTWRQAWEQRTRRTCDVTLKQCKDRHE